METQDNKHNKAMTLKEISERLDAPESTVRLYRDEFEEFLPAIGEGRRRRYDTGTIETLKLITERKKAGAPSATIRQELARTHTPHERRRAVTQEDRVAGIQSTLAAQGGEIALLRAEVGELRAEMGRLIALLRAERQGWRTMEMLQREATAR